MNKITLKKETIDTLKFIGILVFIYFVITLSFTYIPFLNQYNTFSIQTNSMEPVINVGDVVITKTIDPEGIEIGDIIAFNVDISNDGKDDVVVHYIDEIKIHNNQLIFKTKPHISDEQDSWTIEEHDIIGIYMYQINSIGRILLFAQSWVGRVVILVDIIIISVVYDILFGKKKPKESTEEIEEIDDQTKQKVSS